ncbi:WXG100 family type VII secretion target [Brachybacterium massiliense]|uniref:WXG100 family type VII secretion target n=1 Tax=Brachybacterium massiliense TaxID=1755098 RepID=UPI000B3BC196|nr:hypothetical protein [Brachybacterium massiliense]
MNAFMGADTEALRTMGTVCARRAELLADLVTHLAATVDGVEWIGEDADRFRADWTGIVRPALQEQEIVLRQRARHLLQHADEQDEASAVDAPIFRTQPGFHSGPGLLRGGVADLAQGPLQDMMARREEPFAELLRALLGTPEGRALLHGALLGRLLGGLLGDLLLRALVLDVALEQLLAGLGTAGALSDLIGESGLHEPLEAPSEAPAGAPAEASGGQASGVGSAAGEGGTGGDAGGGSGGGSGGSSSGGGAAEAGGAEADTGAGEPSGEVRPLGLQGLEHGPGQSAGSGPGGRFVVDAVQEPRSLLERLLEMLGDAIGPVPAPGGASALSDDIGASALGEARR